MPCQRQLRGRAVLDARLTNEPREIDALAAPFDISASRLMMPFDDDLGGSGGGVARPGFERLLTACGSVANALDRFFNQREVDDMALRA